MKFLREVNNTLTAPMWLLVFARLFGKQSIAYDEFGTAVTLYTWLDKRYYFKSHKKKDA